MSSLKRKLVFFTPEKHGDHFHNLLFLLKFQLQSAFVRNSLHSRFSSRQGGVLPCLVHLVRAVLVL